MTRKGNNEGITEVAQSGSATLMILVTLEEKNRSNPRKKHIITAYNLRKNDIKTPPVSFKTLYAKKLFEIYKIFI